jgi:hypothetical protein
MNDSRQHRFTWLIRSCQDFPEDFPHFTERAVFPALFLPRGDPDWFGRSAYPPRILLFTGETLEVHFHPESGKAPVSIFCDESLSIQTGRFFLIGWIRFVSRGADLRLPYNRRVDEPVHSFLGMLRARLLHSDGAASAEQAFLGDAPDLKFLNALNHEIDKGEVERARLFMAPRLVPSGYWPFRINRTTPGNLLVLTDRRLLWITDTRQRYGSVTCYAHLGNVAQVETGSDAACQLSVSLRNGKIWTLKIRDELRTDATEFAAIAGARMAVI